MFDVLVDEGSPGTGHGIELQRAEAAVDDRGGLGTQLVGRGRTTGPAVCIDADPIVTRTAQQCVHGHPGCLAFDVPERLLEPAHRAIEVHRSSPRREIVEGRLCEFLDATRITSDQVALELIDVCGDLKVAIRLRVALAPAVDAFIGVDANEAKVLATSGVDQEVL